MVIFCVNIERTFFTFWKSVISGQLEAKCYYEKKRYQNGKRDIEENVFILQRMEIEKERTGG